MMRMIGAPSPEQIEAVAAALARRIPDRDDAYFLAALVFDALGAPTEDSKGPDIGAIIARADQMLDAMGVTRDHLDSLGTAALRIGMRAVLDELAPAPRTVLPAEAFDKLAAELDEPAQVIPALTRLAERPRRVQLQQDDGEVTG